MELKTTEIDGLLVVKHDVNLDERGSFTEVFQRARLEALGFPAGFVPVQINVAHNKHKGVLRGIHAEPWDKYITLIQGSAFAAYVDMRRGKNFGKVVVIELTPGMSVMVPAGVGNSYQTLEEDVCYMYAVTKHWQPDQKYPSLYAFDSSLNIPWPIPESDSILSEKDRCLADLTTMDTLF